MHCRFKEWIPNTRRHPHLACFVDHKPPRPNGRAPSPLERYDFGPAGEHLFLDATDDGDGGLVPLPDDDEAAPGAYQ